jgi:hypothetical protein
LKKPGDEPGFFMFGVSGPKACFGQFFAVPTGHALAARQALPALLAAKGVRQQ